MPKTLDDFIDLLEKLILLFDDLADVEQTKLEAVTDKDIDTLSDCMKEEQVFLLQFRGLDKKRETIQKDLGFENMKFSEIISHIKDTQYKQEFQELYNTLKETMDYYQQIHNNAKSIIEINLMGIDKALEVLTHQPAPASQGGATYSPDGQVHNNNITNFTNKII